MTHEVPTISLEILNQTHTLIGGTTGCGKSTLLHTVIYTALACKNKWLLLIDPKRTELRMYKDCTNVLDYACTPEATVKALDDILALMERRQRKAARKGWNMYEGDDIYVIIDELADLMLGQQSKAITRQLQTLLQVARSSRIHLIACTQSPAKATIPAGLQINFTCVCAMACKDSVQSRQLIGRSGCEYFPIPMPHEANQTRYMYYSVAGRRQDEKYIVPYLPESTIQAMIKARPRRWFKAVPA